MQRKLYVRFTEERLTEKGSEKATKKILGAMRSHVATITALSSSALNAALEAYTIVNQSRSPSQWSGYKRKPSHEWSCYNYPLPWLRRSIAGSQKSCVAALEAATHEPMAVLRSAVRTRTQ